MATNIHLVFTTVWGLCCKIDSDRMNIRNSSFSQDCLLTYRKIIRHHAGDLILLSFVLKSQGRLLPILSNLIFYHIIFTIWLWIFFVLMLLDLQSGQIDILAPHLIILLINIGIFVALIIIIATVSNVVIKAHIP